MDFSIEKQELIELYNMARESYYSCVKNPENAYLQDELSFPIEEIELVNSKVKVVFDTDETGTYALEVCLILRDPSAKMTGRFDLIIDEQGEVLDTVLAW